MGVPLSPTTLGDKMKGPKKEASSFEFNFIL